MRCLHALGEYDELVNSAKVLKQQLDTDVTTGSPPNASISVSSSWTTWVHDVNILGKCYFEVYFFQVYCLFVCLFFCYLVSVHSIYLLVLVCVYLESISIVLFQ
jgi:hypothetical protein